jgi:outer membrane receptor protein involved in Fe transport
LLGWGLALTAQGQVTALDPVTVTAARAPELQSLTPFTAVVFSGEELSASPGLTIDDALRAAPDFSLFRRNDSLTANPTTQGVSLRGLGPSGASRSLVLLDGVPFNDAFGGWVPWSLLPRESLAGGVLVPGGGAAAWGNAALAGVVELFSAPLPAGSGEIATRVEEFGTRSAEFSAGIAAGGGTLEVRGQDFTSNGVPLIDPASRGPVDVAAASRHHWISARWRGTLGSGVTATVTVRNYDEWRDNGTPYQQNQTGQMFVSAGLSGQVAPDWTWTATAYVQEQAFSQSFSSVNATRTAETPASDQFAVPSTAAGAAVTSTRKHAGGGTTLVGADVRDVRGETREDYGYANGAYADQRFAGGRESFGGIFAEETQPLGGGVDAMAGLRLDRWEASDGHLRETNVTTLSRLTDAHFPNAAGMEASPSAGLLWRPAADWQIRVAGQKGFRRPTLNELYRPFRQGTTVTEANPALATEHADSGELSATWQHGAWRLRLEGFATILRNPVTSVTLVQGPGTFPGFGTLAAGGNGQERLNLGQDRTAGAELSARWQPAETWSVDFALLDESAVVTAAAVAPQLVGHTLAEVPRTNASLGVSWRPARAVRAQARLRRTGSQFDDDLNTLRLAAATVAEASLTIDCTRRLQLFLTGENLGNARVETAESALGVFSVAPPRMIGAGGRFAW